MKPTTAYTATFSDGTTAQIAKSVRICTVAWLLVRTRDGVVTNRSTGFASSSVAAQNAARRETAHFRFYDEQVKGSIFTYTTEITTVTTGVTKP